MKIAVVCEREPAQRPRASGTLTDGQAPPATWLGAWCRSLALAWLSSILIGSAALAATDDLRLLRAVKEQEPAQVQSLLNAHVDVNAQQPDGATALHWAAHWDDLVSAQLLIRAGAHVDAADQDGVTPLSLACVNGSAAMVRILLDAGANAVAPLWSGETPLMTASRTGNVDAVTALLAHGAAASVNTKGTSRGQTPLMWAAAERHTAIVRLLLEHGADPRASSNSGFTPLLMASRDGSIEVAQLLLDAGAGLESAAPDGSTPLQIASASGQYVLAVFLLEHGAKATTAGAGGMTPLHAVIGAGKAEFYAGESIAPENTALVAASRAGKLTLIHALLAHGAERNARLSKPPARVPGQLVDTSGLDLTGATPFLLAAKLAEVSLMQALASAGADPLLPTKDGTTPLMVAAGIGRVDGGGWQTPVAERGALEAVELAVALGGDVRGTNQAGWTALHGAAVNGADSIVRFLADKGARIDAKNNAGRTPLDIAESFFNGFAITVHSSTADLLRRLASESVTR